MSLKIYYFLPLLFLILTCEKKVESGENIRKDYPNVSAVEVPNVIAFGSCNRVDEPQNLWDDIRKQNPDLWIWLGDNIYGDTEDMDVLRNMYKLQDNIKGYQMLRSSTPILGIWDDHDYGDNNAGAEYPMKKESRDQMFDFLDVGKNNLAWTREGGYQQYVVGDSSHQVHVILLDSRYFRGPTNFDQSGKTYIPDSIGTILGKEQWEWLEMTLSNSTSDIHIIANGIQVLHKDHNYEKWSNFPMERKRLLDLFIKYEIKRPILLSGDRHISEVAVINWSGKNIYEITSSGLTHSYDAVGDELNRYRIGKLVSSKSFALIRIDWKDNINVKAELRGDDQKIFEEIGLKF